MSPADQTELPFPPSGKTGWPWTEEMPLEPPTLPDGSLWPKISIITPSFNQALYLEETIRSVLLQGYPNMEYIIIDGGSSDGSVEIIKKYEPWLAYWVSEKDHGQSEAIHKGFRCATGQIIAWLNSDDLYLPGCLHRVAAEFVGDHKPWLVFGHSKTIDETGHLVGEIRSRIQNARELLLKGNSISQPSAFFLKTAYEQIGGVRQDLHFVMDYDLWVRFAHGGELRLIPEMLSCFRLHSESKTISQSTKFFEEWIEVIRTSDGIEGLVSEDEKQLLIRKTNYRLALEYLLAGNDMKCLEKLRSSLYLGRFPFSDLNEWGNYTVTIVGLSGSENEKKEIDLLADLLETNFPAFGRQNGRILHSALDIRHVFRGQMSSVDTLRHLLRGIWLNPAWLLNRGLFILAIKNILGIQTVKI